MSIRGLLDDIRKQNIVLPEFQREYVWKREQAKQLMVSLYKQYPVGGLLLWNTDNPPELKNVDKLPDRLGTVQVLLDGQQRLTTLHMLMTGEIPTFYSEAEIESDPRDLYFHLETADFQYHQPSRMDGDAMWRRTIDCFTDNLNVFEIAAQTVDGSNERFTLAQRLNESLNQLRSIVNIDLPKQIVPSDATLDDAIDIFDRVNSQGTKLTDAELALTHVTWQMASCTKGYEEKDRRMRFPQLLLWADIYDTCTDHHGYRSRVVRYDSRSSTSRLGNRLGEA